MYYLASKTNKFDSICYFETKERAEKYMAEKGLSEKYFIDFNPFICIV